LSSLIPARILLRTLPTHACFTRGDWAVTFMGNCGFVHAAAVAFTVAVASAASCSAADAQARTFACGEGRAVTLTETGPGSISVGPIEGATMALHKSRQNPLQFDNGDYRVTISPDQTRIDVDIPDFGTVKCTQRPGMAAHQRPGIGNADPCGPGFRQAPETDRCDPVPGNVDTNSRPARRTGRAAGDFPMEGRSLGGIVRSSPTQSSSRIASLGNGDTVTILKRDVEMDGYSWFQIRFRGRTGYQWGGIMCSQNPIRGIYQQCEP
jgi:hypothetical protein